MTDPPGGSRCLSMVEEEMNTDDVRADKIAATGKVVNT